VEQADVRLRAPAKQRRNQAGGRVCSGTVRTMGLTGGEGLSI